MREIKSPRQLGVSHSNPPACPERSRSGPIHVTFGPAGTASNESVEFDATAEWLNHIEAGRMGGP